MAMSKHQLTGSLSHKTLTLEGKIKLLDSNRERKQNLQHLAEQFSIVKTETAKILKNESFIQKECKLFKGKTDGQFHEIKEILRAWFQKCYTGNIYPDGAMLKEETIKIKKCLDPDEFYCF